MYLDDLLQKKWNIDAETNEGLLFCHMTEINEQIYLHRLYKKLEDKEFEKIEKSLNINIIPELREFYKHYNGCRLFHSSINIYGFECGDSKPMAFVLNNINLNLKLVNNNIIDKDIVYIGNVGNYLIYYKQSEILNPKIYLSRHGELKIHKQFSSLEELLKYYIMALSYEYDKNGYRKHPKTDKLYKKFPVIANSFNGDIDWEIPTETQEKTR